MTIKHFNFLLSDSIRVVRQHARDIHLYVSLRAYSGSSI